MGKVSNLTLLFLYQQGSDARSRLDWFHAADPNLLITENYQVMASIQKMNLEKIEHKWIWLLFTKLITNNNLENGASYSVVEDVNKDKTFNLFSLWY